MTIYILVIYLTIYLPSLTQLSFTSSTDETTLYTFFREPFTLLNLACTHCIHCVHLIEFTPTSFRQTLYGCFILPITCIVPVPKDSHITLVLSSFYFGAFFLKALIPFPQHMVLSIRELLWPSGYELQLSLNRSLVLILVKVIGR